MCRGLNFLVGVMADGGQQGLQVLCASSFSFFFFKGVEVMVGVYALQTSSPSVLLCFLCPLLYKQEELMCTVQGIISGHLKWELF